jgi:hypothetical protein
MEFQPASRIVRVFIFILFSLVAALILTPFISNILCPSSHDMTNHIVGVIQARMGLEEGQFPLRIARYHDWRYPLFQFYSPSAYMLGGWIYEWLTPWNPYVAEKILLWIFLLLGETYIYRLAFELLGSRRAAILAAVAYVLMPYNLLTLNYIGSFNEVLAMGIIPAVLYYTFRRYDNPDDTSTLLKMSLAWYLLITIHLVTFVLSSFYVGLLLFFATCKNRRWMKLIDAGVAYAFACFLAMWYLAPIALLHDFFSVGRSFNVNVFYDLYHVTAAQLFSLCGSITAGKKSVDGGVSILSQVHPNLGIVMLFAVALCSWLFFKKLCTHAKKYFKNDFDFWLGPLLLVFFIGFFLVWSPFNFWLWLPKSFYIFQYTWRMLGQLMWIGALLFAASLCVLFQYKLDGQHTFVGVILLMIIAVCWFPTGKKGYANFEKKINNSFYHFNNDYLLDTRKSFAPLQMHYDNQNLPEKIPALYVASKPVIDPTKTLSMEQMLSHCSQQKTTTLCQVDVPAIVNLVQLPVLEYPGMLKISVNGIAVPYKGMPYRDLNITAITPESGKNNVIRIQFNGMDWANELSLISWGVWFLYCGVLFVKRKKTQS